MWNCMVLALSLAVWTSLAAMAQDVEFCRPPLSEGIMRAHANFGATYEFDVLENGVPANVKSMASHFLDGNVLQECIMRWRLPQASSKHLVAVFEWEHGTGWVALRVRGPEFKLNIRLSGEGCPYRTMAAKAR